MSEEKQLLTAEEIHQLKSKGYESRGAGFTKDNKFVSNKEVDEIISQIRETSPFKLIEKRLDTIEKDLVDVYDYVTSPDDLTKRVDVIEQDVHDIYDYVTTPDKPSERDPAEKEALAKLSSIADGMNTVANNLAVVQGLLSGVQQAKKVDEFKSEEAKLEAVPTSKPGAAATSKKKEDTSSIGGLLKDFFTNPAVIAAFSGLVYLFLPKDVKEKISGFFSGFAKGALSTSGELSTFEKGLIAAGVGLTTYLGAAALQKVGEALTTVTQLIAASKKKFGKYFKKGGLKELGKDVGEKAAKGVSVGGVAAAAAGATTAGVLMAGDDKKKEDGKAESKPSPAATPSTPAPESQQATQVPGTGIKPGEGGLGVKPGKGGLGIKAEGPPPTMTGEDKPVMDMIKKHEGVRTRPYKDSLGLWTVGVGHLIGNGKSLPAEMDREFSMSEVDAMFAKDYKEHKDAAQKIPGFEKLNESGKAALIDLTFNMGPAWYKRWPNFSKALAAGDTEGAAKSLEDSKWYTQVGNRARTIVSLLRGGGSASGGVLASSTPSAIPENKGATTGEKVAAASVDVEAASTSKGTSPSVVNNSINGSKIAQGKGAPQAPMSIPAPIASRGSLDSGTKYNSAYM